MRIVPIIQARMSSRRFPGKILTALGDTTMLGMLIDNLRHCVAVETPWIATSTDASDDPVELFAERQGVNVFRGPLDNVALRMLQAADTANADALVRVNGDSPLLDPALVDRAARLFRDVDVDLVSNVAPRSFPKGQSVEVVARAALAKALARMTTAAEREHVTVHFYNHPGDWHIRSFTTELPRAELQLSVDEPADLVRCAAILRWLGQPAWQAGWEQCVRAADAVAIELAQAQ